MSLNAQVKIDVILHATENQETVFTAFQENLGVEQEHFQIQNLTGHFDNPITFLSINLKKKNAELFIINFFKMFSKADYNKIYENIDENISNSGLTLKISKQNMLEGKILLENKDAIKINISCPVYVKKNSKKIYQRLLKLDKNSK